MSPADSNGHRTDEELFDDAASQDGPISMEYYHSSRRKPRPPTWPYLVSAVVMGILLLALVIYQDSCGAGVSEVLFPGQ